MAAAEGAQAPRARRGGNVEDGAERDTMSVGELSRRLGLGINQTYRALEAGQLPGRRVGKRWIVSRAAYREFMCGAHATRTEAAA